MSTRSNIKIMDSQGAVLLYKHHDGYPKGPNGMVSYLTRYAKASGLSAEGMAHDMLRDEDCSAAAFVHGDIRYYYEVNIDTGVIKVCEYDMLKKSSKLIDTVKIDYDASINDYTIAGGYVLHLEDKQIEEGQHIMEECFTKLEEWGDIDVAQYVAAELTNKLWEFRKDQLGDSPAEQAELEAIKAAGH